MLISSGARFLILGGSCFLLFTASCNGEETSNHSGDSVSSETPSVEERDPTLSDVDDDCEIEGPPVVDTHNLHAWIDSTIPSVIFLLAYEVEVEPELELVRPDGRILAEDNISDLENVSFKRQESIPPSVGFMIDRPMPGKWMIRIDGQSRHPANDGYYLRLFQEPLYPLKLNTEVRLSEEYGYATVLVAEMLLLEAEYKDGRAVGFKTPEIELAGLTLEPRGSAHPTLFLVGCASETMGLRSTTRQMIMSLPASHGHEASSKISSLSHNLQAS